MVGHTALVYACAAVTTGGATLVASGSEDNTARVWDASGQCLQVGCLGGGATLLRGLGLAPPPSHPHTPCMHLPTTPVCAALPVAPR